MRASLVAVVLVAALSAGCTPYIPVKGDFATSAAVTTVPTVVAGGDIPPDYEAFNMYDPRVNALLAQQYCATPYEPLETRIRGGSAGAIQEARGRCRTHIPLLGP